MVRIRRIPDETSPFFEFTRMQSCFKRFEIAMDKLKMFHPECHPERSEGSGPGIVQKSASISGQILHCVQDDTREIRHFS